MKILRVGWIGSPPPSKMGHGSPVFFPVPRQLCVRWEPSVKADSLRRSQMASFCWVTAWFFLPSRKQY